MVDITETYVDSLALNSAAIKNGRDLVKKNSFPKLCLSDDRTLVFGECKGSGKEPYRCSADYIKPESPVFRCSCPSRQFPCKHILGLLYAYAAGAPFQTEDVPEEIADKREKVQKREDKKQESLAEGQTEPAAKRKTNKSALVKKIAAQLDGLQLLNKLVRDIVQTGLAGVDAKALRTLEEQAKQLGNYYLPGAQASFRELLQLLGQGNQREQDYTEAMDRMTYLHMLAKKSTEYLTARKENPDLPMATDSAIEELLGHAWQLAELKEAGLVLADAELLQLGFHSYTDEVRGEYVDEGWWIHLQTGAIYSSRYYRPFRAAKHIKEEDSTAAVVQAKECFVYPGDANPRIRWESVSFREPQRGDWDIARSHSHRSYAEAVKMVKNQIKNPLSDKHPVVLLHASRLFRAGDTYAIADEAGKTIALSDLEHIGHPGTQLLPLLKDEHREGQAVLVMFGHDLDTGRLHAQPLGIVTDNGLVRLI